MKQLTVPQIGIIRAWRYGENGGAWTHPGLSPSNFQTLWIILHQIEQDWIEAVQKIDPKKYEDDPNLQSFDAYREIEPRYIQNLFSYINFFFLLETGFKTLADELKELSQNLDLKIKTENIPEHCAYIKKLKLVRNKTVVHWGEKKAGKMSEEQANRHKKNTSAGRRWGAYWKPTGDVICDLTNMGFGSMTVSGAEDRKLSSLPETHKICAAYLQQCDEICAALLKEIMDQIPITKNEIKYEAIYPRSL